MIVGVIICLRSNNWIIIWCGLEITLISFLPIMSNKIIISSESILKYFLIQRVRSSILILGLILILIDINLNEFIISIAILLKIGVAPFHNWLLRIIEGLSFYTNMLLLTILKLAPLILFSYINIRIMFIVMLTILIGSIAGLNQTSTRKIIVYSSIFNIGLIMVSMKINSFWLFYFAIYSVLVFRIFYIFTLNNTNYVNQIIFNDKTLLINISTWFLLLSLGGLPPFIGFSAKLIILEYMISEIIIINMIIIICCSLLVMFFYTRMTFISIIFLSLRFKTKLVRREKFNIFIMICNIMFLPVILSFKSFM